MAFPAKNSPQTRFRKHSPTALTSHSLQELLPPFLAELGKVYHNRPDLILAAWPGVIGKELAPMTQALSFIDGVLMVKVKNSTLYSLLNGQDKPRILKNLRDKFSGVGIKTIHFRIG